ncbi:putative disease resistance RPP13-like protein 2 [Phragmites australis]|uniref:putative disease resistance RPP13-like protein 2 n=1 Tax=Phragmites australis TaxID=29695 RepID=UPI002D773126|nr:putative disease resistance RPP13-like protein 2 [Phragmites australis]
MAEAIIGPLVGKLQELAVSEARALVAVNDDIRSLRDKLMWMQAFLRDADPRRRVVPDEASRVWLHQTRDAAFDAEDAVDQYFLLVDLSRYPSWTRTIIRFVAGFTTQIRVRRNLSSKIEAINSRLENIVKNKDKYKQIEDSTDKTVVPWRASTTISVAPTKLDNLLQPPLVSREDKHRELDSALRGGTARLQVISLTGQSGVGKSTLVRDAYERLAIKNHFDMQALATFPPYSSASDILKLILRDLTENDFTLSKKDVSEQLNKELEGKKYLVVIDGEVSTTEWKHILAALPYVANSRVVRMSKERPEEPPGNYDHLVIQLDRFDEDATIELFQQRVHREESSPKYNEAVRNGVVNDYRQDIFDTTEGLPLAIVLLSGLLRTKEFPVEWKAVFDHLRSKQSKRLDSILSLCFDDLPYDVKSCFLYFAALPTNMLIEAQDLVCMWMAEGFLRPKEGMTIEKVGYRYLKELIARHLINPEPMDENSPEEELVSIQSKVHAFLQIEAQEVNFVEIHNSDDIPALSTARRLSLQNRMDKYATLTNPIPKLRSILSNFEKEEISKEYESISKFLRVINLQGLEVGDKLPNEIGDVVHLQYLAVTSCSLSEIPPSVGRLTNLQTLDVRDTAVEKLPESFWKIRTLRHVFGHCLILPKRVGDLKNLQTLDTIKPDKYGWDRNTLAKMIHLRSLFIWKLSEGHLKVLAAALKKLKHLVTLTIHGDGIPSSVFTSSSLRRLEVLELDGKLDMPSEPNDIKSCLPNLLLLSLEKTMVSQDFINKLAELPFLASLTLDVGSYKDGQLVFSPGGFHSLKRLTIDLIELKKVKIHESSLPRLVDLDILSYSNDLEIEIVGKSNIVDKLRGEDENLYKKIKRTPRTERAAGRH